MKTALILAGEIITITEEVIEKHDILQIQTNGSHKTHPMVVMSVLPVPKVPPLDDPDALKHWKDLDAEQLAYLHYDEKLAQKYTQKKKSQKLEKSLAKNLGGKVTPGSGAFGFHKGDVDSALWRAEHKYTDKNFYSLTLKTWLKIKNEALDANKLPLMEIVLNQSVKPYKLIVMDLLDFQNSTDATEEEFLTLFFIKMLECKPNAQSIRLTESILRSHTVDVQENYPTKIPAFFLKISQICLFAMETIDFVRIYNSD